MSSGGSNYLATLEAVGGTLGHPVAPQPINSTNPLPVSLTALSVGGTLTDASITSLSGSSQQLLAAGTAKRYLIIENTGLANIGVNPAGGTAVIGGTGTLTIVPTGSYELAAFIPGAAINIIGTAGQPVTCLWG